MIHGKIFVGHLMDLARHVLGLRHILLDCVGHFGRTLCGLEYELENDIDLESQTHANTPPSYDVSIEIFHLSLVFAKQLLIISHQGQPECQRK